MPPPRIHVPVPLVPGSTLALPPAAVRHVQVLRLQPGDPLTVFNGEGGEHAATVSRMGRSDASVAVGERAAVDRELRLAVTLALGMPANDSMDALIEKATELGVATIQPLLCERSVLRLSGERADKRREHWQAIAVSASEQSGRTRVPLVGPVRPLRDWLAGASGDPAARWMLSLRDATRPFRAEAAAARVVFLSGPEGGLSEAEESLAIAAGFAPVSLGARTLRADTAPLAALAAIALAALPA